MVDLDGLVRVYMRPPHEEGGLVGPYGDGGEVKGSQTIADLPVEGEGARKASVPGVVEVQPARGGSDADAGSAPAGPNRP